MEEDRLGCVRLLLETLLSYLPGELRSCLASPSGPAPSSRVPCSACRGAQVVRRGKRTHLCPACEGYGWRKRRAGEPFFDEYTREEIGSAQPLRSATSWELDASLARLASAEAERNGHTNEASWVRKKRSLYANGDYAALERSVARAREDHPRPVKAAWQILVLGYDETLLADRAMVEEGVEAIARFMPPSPRVPHWLIPDPHARKQSLWYGRSPRHELLRSERNQEIRRLHSEGEGLTKIGKRYGITKMQVWRVVQSPATLGPGAGNVPSAQ